MSALISVTATTGLLDAISDAGGDCDAVLRTVGLKRAALADPDGFIASAAFARLLSAAARDMDDAASACTSASASTPGTRVPSLTCC